MKILAVTSPAIGHLHPTIPVLLELQRRGHRVRLITLASEVERLRALGIDAAPMDPAIESIQQDDHLAGNALSAIRRTIAVGTRRARLELPQMQAEIASLAPDAALVDTNCWGAAVAAEAWGGPWAVLQHFLTPLPSPEVPPFGPGLRPIGGPLGRVRNRVLGPLVMGGFEHALLPPVNALRAEQGLRRLRSATDFFTTAPLTIYFTSTAFEHPRRSWPSSFRFVGPVVWNPPTDPPPRTDGSVRPIVLVTTSSEFQDDAAIVAAAVRGLAEEDVDVVATMPAGAPPGDDLPPNARIERWAPHGALLSHAVVAVTHGGMGATQKALLAGVPVVVVPFGRDQLEVARRVEVAGVGVILPRRRLTPESMRAAVARARDRSAAAREFASRLQREPGAAGAADAVEALVAARASGDAAPA